MTSFFALIFDISFYNRLCHFVTDCPYIVSITPKLSSLQLFLYFGVLCKQLLCRKTFHYFCNTTGGITRICSGKHHLWFPNQNLPSTPWEARINELFDAATVIPDPTGRKALYDEWQEIVADELPLIFTVGSERLLCISKRVGNVNPSMHGGLLHNIEELFVID